MKTIKILAIALVGLSVVSCNNTGAVKTKKSLDSNIDSVSYAIGLNMGLQMKKDAKELDPSLFVQGYLNGVDSSSLLMKPADTRNIINAFFQKKRVEMMKKKQEEQRKKAEVEFGDYKKENEKFIADNKAKDGVKTTESGLQYIVVKEGSGDAPKATSRVKVNYIGKLIDGTEFDKSGAEPAEFGVNQVIKGWTEGLQLMKPGAKYKFFIPQDLAYGAQQRGAKIKPFSALVFDVELVEVK